MKRVLTRIAVLAVVLGIVIGSSNNLVGTADAINPAQTTVTGTVNYEYWDLEAFWKPLVNHYGYTYTRPGVQYFDYYDSTGRLVDFNVAGCGSTATQHGAQGFYCPTTRTIYLDYNQQKSELGRLGDGAVGFWLAHEFGHHIQTLMGLKPQTPNMELQADCFAGLYVHYGILNSHRLASDDYAQARNQIWALSWNDPTHGTPQQRLNNFDRGYSQFYVPSCVNGY
jgi:predicted metalloprotease